MELFSEALKANLYRICRLCGTDNHETISILGPDAAQYQSEGEPTLNAKIEQCIGFTVRLDDKMPQSLCVLCVEKLNDFHDFREMCFATNAQTRELLGLQKVSPKQCKCEGDLKPEAAPTPGRRGKKRKSDEVQMSPPRNGRAPKAQKKLRLSEAATERKPRLKEEMKIEATDAAQSRHRNVCSVCADRFPSKAKLQKHQITSHVPNIVRYVCTACNETLKKAQDIKSHQLWHKLSKTPFVCAVCKSSLINIYAYSRHIREHTLIVSTTLRVYDRECPQCHVVFPTNFLYNTHPCAVRTKHCAGCDRQLREADFLKHSAACPKTYLNYSRHIAPAVASAEANICIKNENEVEAEAQAGAAVVQATGGGDASTGIGRAHRKSNVLRRDLQRVDQLLQATIDELVSIKHEPEVPMEGACDFPDDGDEDCGDNGTEDLRAGSIFEPELVIKQELLEVCDGDNIKKEVLEEAATEKVPVLILKIKKEHGTLNSSLVDEESDTRSERKRKRKKRKEYQRSRENIDHNQNMAPTTEVDGCFDAATALKIKTELLEEAEAEEDVKPPIPALSEPSDMLFRISNVASGVEFTQDVDEAPRPEGCDGNDSEATLSADEDVKPDKLHLDRLIEMSTDDGISAKSGESPTAEANAPDVATTPIIKAEVMNREYGDEEPSSPPPMVPTTTTACGSEEHSFISIVDFESLEIKREKDCVDVYEERRAEVDSLEGDDDGEEEAEAEDREYREMEMPPLLASTDPAPLPQNITIKMEPTEVEDFQPLCITDVRSEAVGALFESDGPNEAEVDPTPVVSESTTIVGVIKEEILESPLDARPFFEPNVRPAEALSTESDSEPESDVEERQNLLNHVRAASEASSLPGGTEETENILNESLQQQQRNEEPVPPSGDVAGGESLLNEIAENHNNANIERELLEEVAQDSNVGASV